MLRHRWIASFALLIFLLIGVFSLTPEFAASHNLVSDRSSYSIEGNFEIDGTFPINEKSVARSRKQYEDILLWGSWAGDDSHTGKLLSPAFAPPKILSLFVAGYPNSPGNQLYLERIDTKERLPFVLKDPGEDWVKVCIALPVTWRDRKVQIVAIDDATSIAGWLGVSSPLSESTLGMLCAQIASTLIVPIYAIHFLLFLLPGLLLAIFFRRCWAIHDGFMLILSVMFSALIGYITFWVYFFNQSLGLVFSYSLLFVVLICSIYCLLFRRKESLKAILSTDIFVPGIVMFLTGLFYLAIAYMAEPNLGLPERFSQDPIGWRLLIGGDNILPQLFAEKLFHGEDPRSLFFDWLSSDRPPLQAGIVLVQRPIMFSADLSYHALATVLQCSWVVAMWALCRTAEISVNRISWVMAFSIFSGFFLYNTVYVWPKLLAGALVIFAFSLILESALKWQKIPRIHLCLIAMAMALGLLAHGGVVFTFPAIFFMLVLPKLFPGFRNALIAFSLFVFLMTPWTAYQKLYDPPGNRLVKWHLAGVRSIDQRSSLQTIFDAYKALSVSKIFHNKWENMKVLLGAPATVSRWRPKEFFHIFRSLNVLNIGWIFFGLGLFFKRFRRWYDANSALSILLLASLGNLAIWTLVLFGPGQTIVHHGSYATTILLFVGLSTLLSRLPRFVKYVLIFTQLIVFANTWIGWSVPAQYSSTIVYTPNIPMLILSAVIFIGLLEILIQLSYSSTKSPEEKFA